ncbi:hypothetical protein BKA56DRAFT_343412 [Ilyonectria sp. MPI-CAGE-AT-0026]|nr:hypothetical protein BKA56DRAFT_343412 [Ilyonectria sp. MPI-CAGE-AT-0026]
MIFGMSNGAIVFVCITSVRANTNSRMSTLIPIPTEILTPSLASDAFSTPKPLSNNTVATPPSAPMAQYLSDGTIAAIVVGGTLTLAIVAFVVWICIQHRKKIWKTHSPTILPTRLVLPEETRELPEICSQADRTKSASWLAYQDIWDLRETSSQGVRSPTPKPALAEVKSYTRARQRAQLCNVGGRRRPVAELPGSEMIWVPTQLNISPMSPISPTDSMAPKSRLASPTFHHPRSGPSSRPSREDRVSDLPNAASQISRWHPRHPSPTLDTTPNGSSRNIPNCDTMSERQRFRISND